MKAFTGIACVEITLEVSADSEAWVPLQYLVPPQIIRPELQSEEITERYFAQLGRLVAARVYTAE